MHKDKIDYDKIYHSNNYGDFKILRRVASNESKHIMVEVEFIDTKTRINVRYCDALIGNIKDYYRKTMCGVACTGRASSYHPAYRVWEGMIHRCYDPKCPSYNRYGAKGISVCDRWLCFENFLNDLPFIEGYEKWLKNPSLYHFDKDYKQRNTPYDKKIYSPETCCFLQAADNIALARMDKNESSNSTCKYVGVRRVTENSFNAFISVNGAYHNIGTYPTAEMAAAAYNNACNIYYTDRKILNDVQYIRPNELINHIIAKKEMCKII